MRTIVIASALVGMGMGFFIYYATFVGIAIMGGSIIAWDQTSPEVASKLRAEQSFIMIGTMLTGLMMGTAIGIKTEKEMSTSLPEDSEDRGKDHPTKPDGPSHNPT